MHVSVYYTTSIEAVVGIYTRTQSNFYEAVYNAIVITLQIQRSYLN